jgi:ribonuclease J
MDNLDLDYKLRRFSAVKQKYMIDTIMNKNINGKPVRIVSLAGTETVTKNMTLYECDDTIIALDCGVDFPDDDQLGVNLVIPDFTYLRENSHKFKAVFITHGHEDHIGAVPFLLEEFDVPIYGTKLVQGFLYEKFEDRQFKDRKANYKPVVFEPGMDPVEIGPFKVSCFGVNHSVPAATGVVIDTPQGRILHMADFKIDATPILDKPIDLGEIEAISKDGVLCLLSDCLGITTPGSSKSESTLNDTFGMLFEKYTGRQIIVTTLSTSISRMHQIFEAAQKVGRQVVISGMSMHKNSSVARRLGYLNFDDNLFIKEDNAADLPQDQLIYLVAGCYGQHGSGLDRISRNEHRNIFLREDSVVIFSGDPSPPGVDVDVERVQANLTILGANVIFGEIQDNLHVSGHGTHDDLMKIAKIVNPKYYIPIGGTVVKMRVYSNALQEELNVPKANIFEQLEGQTTVFENGRARRGDKIEVKQIYIGNNSTDEINPLVLRDRDAMCSDGVFVVVVPISKNGKQLYPDKVEIVTRGFIYVKESKQFMNKSKKFIVKALNKYKSGDKNWKDIRRKLERDIEKYIRKESRSYPMVIVHSLNV